MNTATDDKQHALISALQAAAAVLDDLEAALETDMIEMPYLSIVSQTRAQCEAALRANGEWDTCCFEVPTL